MRLADVSRLAAQLDGVAERRREGMLDWRLTMPATIGRPTPRLYLPDCISQAAMTASSTTSRFPFSRSATIIMSWAEAFRVGDSDSPSPRTHQSGAAQAVPGACQRRPRKPLGRRSGSAQGSPRRVSLGSLCDAECEDPPSDGERQELAARCDDKETRACEGEDCRHEIDTAIAVTHRQNIVRRSSHSMFALWGHSGTLGQATQMSLVRWAATWQR